MILRELAVLMNMN